MASILTEAAVINGVLNEPHKNHYALNSLLEGDFTSDVGRQLWIIIKKRFENNQNLNKTQIYTDLGGYNQQAADLLTDLGTSDLWGEIDEYADKLLEKRKFNMAQQEIANFGVKLKEGVSLNESLEKLNNNLSLLAKKEITAEDENTTWEFANNEWLEYINAKKEGNTNIIGYSWNLESLDKISSGLQKGKYFLIGGLKKAGKSRFGAWLLYNLINQGAKALFLSLEMRKQDILDWLYGIKTKKILDKRFLSNEDYIEIGKVQPTIFNQYQNTLFISSKPWQDTDIICRRIRNHVNKYGIDTVLIDHFQRINQKTYKDTARQYEISAQKLADLTRELNIILIVLSQLNVLAEKEERPDIAFIKGSGGIADAADCIMVLHNLDRKNKEVKKRQVLEFQIVQRHGPSGNIKLSADLGLLNFQELSFLDVEEEF